MVDRKFLSTTAASDVRLVGQEHSSGGAHPDVVTESGSQFTAKDFNDLVRRFSFDHIRNWTCLRS